MPPARQLTRPASALLLLFINLIGHADTAYISIIIDDVGHHRERVERALEIPSALTFSVLPYSQFSRQLANQVHGAGREVMLHMPMANISGQDAGPGTLKPDQDQTKFVQLIDDALAQVPNASGINNHMGSLLTTRPGEMAWVMEWAKSHNLYFIDSRTTAATVASTIAAEHNVRSASRDVFLDNDPELTAIDQEFDKLVARAQEAGAALAIAHPYPTTISYLEQKLPTLEQEGIKVVPVSHLIALKQALDAKVVREVTSD